MRMVEIIRKKRDGGELTDGEIAAFVTGYTRGDIPDEQASALCMAIWFRGMTARETLALTLAIRDSGECLTHSPADGVRVDKHSTGGVGDKTSLIVAPIVASLGLKVAKMSGRGLGHTGGPIDKLESIRGFRTDLSPREFARVADETGLAIVGQSAELAPADKKIYALRDVTATVDSLPLIASSIMGKKLAANDDAIVLDVKTGSGAFMKTRTEARALAECMVKIGTDAGKKMCALVTDMDTPLGCAIGNSLEVVEAVETLRGGGPEDLRRLCIALAAHMLLLGGRAETLPAGEKMAQSALADGSALATFTAMVAAQGGDVTWIQDLSHFPRAGYREDICATRDGCLTRIDAGICGEVSLILGAGRTVKDAPVDAAAGILLRRKRGEHVRAGDCVATLYTERPEVLPEARERLLRAVEIGETLPPPVPLILDVIGGVES